jgi:hypothetical protein
MHFFPKWRSKEAGGPVALRPLVGVGGGGGWHAWGGTRGGRIGAGVGAGVGAGALLVVVVVAPSPGGGCGSGWRMVDIVIVALDDEAALRHRAPHPFFLLFRRAPQLSPVLRLRGHHSTSAPALEVKIGRRQPPHHPTPPPPHLAIHHHRGWGRHGVRTHPNIFTPIMHLRGEHFSGRAGFRPGRKKIILFWAQKILPKTIPLDASGQARAWAGHPRFLYCKITKNSFSGQVRQKKSWASRSLPTLAQ